MCFSVGYSAVALNHVIDFKEKKQVIFLWVICSYCLFFSKLASLLHVSRQLQLQNAHLDTSTNLSICNKTPILYFSRTAFGLIFNLLHVLSHKNSFLSVVNFLRLEHSFCLPVNLTHDSFNNFILFSFKEIIKPVSPSELFPSLPIVQVCLVTFSIYTVILNYPFLPLCVCICDFVYEVLIKK